MSNDYSRRSVLKLGGGLVSIAALGGCTSVLSGDGDSSGDLDAVPAGSVFVAKIDVERVLADETFREKVNALMQSEGGMPFEPDTVEELLDQYEADVGLDQRDVSSALYFHTGEDNPGTIIEADWSESDIQSTLEQNGYNGSPDTYNGKSVYSMSEWNADVAVLSDGRYVLGQPDPVKNCLDVAAGDSDSVSGSLVDGYNATRDGYMQFAFTWPDGFEPNDLPNMVDKSDVMAMQYGAGAMYRGDTRGAAIELEFDSSDAAKSMQEVMAGGKTIAAGQFSEMEMPAEIEADPEELIRSTSIKQDGSTVTIENTTGGGAIEVMMLAVVSSFVLGLGNTSREVVPPTVDFEVDYDQGEGTITITHHAGDSVRANELYIRGDGLEQTGRWDQLSDSTGPTDMVAAGDSLTLEAETDYKIVVMWRSPDTDDSVVFTESRGPDA